MTDAVRSRQAERGDFIDHLAKCCAARKTRDREAARFHARLHTGERTTVAAQTARIAADSCSVHVAIQREAAATLHARIQPAGALRVEDLATAVSRNGIERVRLNVAEQRRASILLRVIGNRDPHVASDLALHKDRASSGIVSAAIGERARQLRELTFERRAWRHRQAAAAFLGIERQDTVEKPNDQHGAHAWNK